MMSVQIHEYKAPTSSPNGSQRAEKPLQPDTQSKLSRLFSTHFELPEWGKLKMSDAGRFSMPYALLAILVSLLAVVIGAVVTIGLAVAGACIWVVISVTEMKTNVAQMARVQQTQSAQIDGLKAYVNRETNEVVMLRTMLPPATRAEVERWERENPRPNLPSTPDKEN